MASAPPESVHPLTRDEWREWLAAHHTRAAGVWFISFKKSAGQPRVTYDESVEEALCFGWIDSKPNKLDDERTMLWFAPRKAGTGWSKPNKDRVERLIAAGLMEPAGLAKVHGAQQDGSWSALDGVEELAVPDDLRIALDSYPAASANFDAFPRSARRGILEWILNARRTETRAARIAETARMAQDGERANQWRPKG